MSFFLSFFLLFGEFGVGTNGGGVVVKDDGFGLVSKDKRRRRGAVLITASTSRHTRLGVRAHPGGRLFFFKGRGENKSTFCACIGACSHV